MHTFAPGLGAAVHSSADMHGSQILHKTFCSASAQNVLRLWIFGLGIFGANPEVIWVPPHVIEVLGVQGA